MSAARVGRRHPRSTRRGSRSCEASERVLRVALRALGELRRARPELPDELHDKVHDKVIDLLLRRPELGTDEAGNVSPTATRNIVRRNFVWTVKSWQRDRFDAQGRVKEGPRTAFSLDATSIGADGSSAMPILEKLRTDIDPERVVIGREALSSTLATAHDSSPETVEILCDYIRGYGPGEISRRRGMAENAVSARKSRFVRSVAGGRPR